MELELSQHAELQHTLDTQSKPSVEEKRESALWLPIASHNVSMFFLKIFLRDQIVWGWYSVEYDMLLWTEGRS